MSARRVLPPLIQLHLASEWRRLQTVNGNGDVEIAGSCRFHSARAEPVSAEQCEECQGFVPSVIEMRLYICKSFYASQLSSEASPRDGQPSLPGPCQTGGGARGRGSRRPLDVTALSGPRRRRAPPRGEAPAKRCGFSRCSGCGSATTCLLSWAEPSLSLSCFGTFNIAR